MIEIDPQTMLPIAAAWSAYFAAHSLLASDRVKNAKANRWPRLMGKYRLTYNLIALALLGLPLMLTSAARGERLWTWPGGISYLADIAAGLAAVGFVVSLFAYDLGVFSGLRAEAEGVEGEGRLAGASALRISFFHRFVRHPWYFFGLVMLWSREMDLALLTTASVTTVYLIVGSRIEENRLLRSYPERYQAYRRAVSGLLPLPWRTLSAEAAAKLETR